MSTHPSPRDPCTKSASGSGRPCQGRCSPAAHSRIAAVVTYLFKAWPGQPGEVMDLLA